MQKEDVISLITYLLMIGFAFGMGFGVVQPAIVTDGLFQANDSKGMIFLFLFVAIVIGIILIGVLIELAHVIGAKIGKYNVLSVNIFGFSVFKTKDEKGKLKSNFKFPQNFDGLTGETIISPKGDKSKPTFYIFAPMFLFLLDVLATVLIFYFIKDDPKELYLMYLKYGSFIVTTIGGMVIIYDYFPAKLDNANDGYKLISLNKKSNIVAYNEYLRVKACEFFNEEPGEIMVFDEINDFTAKVNMLSVHNLIDVDYKKALEMIDKIVVDPTKIAKSTFNTIQITKAYILFMYDEVENAKNFYITGLNEEQRKLCVSCTLPLYIRTYILYEGLVEKSDSEVELAISKSKKAINRINVAEQEEEKLLLEKAIKKTKELKKE